MLSGASNVICNHFKLPLLANIACFGWHRWLALLLASIIIGYRYCWLSLLLAIIIVGPGNNNNAAVCVYVCMCL